MNAPWSIVKNSWQYTTIHDASGEVICALDLEDWGVMEDNQEELEARQAKVAAQIAAVPDLLAACNFVANRLVDSDCEYDDVAAMVLELRSAIRKAEGAQ